LGRLLGSRPLQTLVFTSSAAGFTAYNIFQQPLLAKECYKSVRDDIAKLFDKDDNLAPTVVILGWHAAGTYSQFDKTGGSDGALMRFAPEKDHGCNAGLALARDSLEAIKKAHPEISYADLWTLAAVVAVEYMGGPVIPWRPGRSDHRDNLKTAPDGRLPDAARGADHVRAIFYRMGFNDQEITALVGAHGIGRCHPEASGFSGPWTRSPTTWSNQFFTEVLDTKKWKVKQWSGPLQYTDPSGDLMMLPADMVFAQDPDFKKWSEIYANDEAKWNADFSKAFSKLLELGVKSVEKDGWF